MRLKALFRAIPHLNYQSHSFQRQKKEVQISRDKKRDVLALPKAWAVNQLAMLC